MFSNGSYEEAIEAYENSIDTALSTTVAACAWYNKDMALKGLKLDAEAEKAFDKAEDLGY